MGQPKREPDFRGAGPWRAWRAKAEREGAGIAGWLVFCPGAHAAWSYWWIMLIHLRPMPGEPEAVITTPGAQWEIMCVAQAPDVEPDPDEPKATLRHLTPIDWAVQFADVKDDEKAIEVAEDVIRAIMTGTRSPDSDFRSFWKRAIPETAKCRATGKHSPS